MDDPRLGRWPISIEVPVAWGDMDVLGHVNNTIYLRWFESARVAYFEGTGLLEKMASAGKGPILARQSIDYRMPVAYPDKVRIDITITKIGRTSLSMAFRITSNTHGVVAAEGEGVGVMVHYSSGAKVEVDEEMKAAIYAIEARGR